MTHKKLASRKIVEELPDGNDRTRIVMEEVDMTEYEVRDLRAEWEFYRGPYDEPLGRRVAEDGVILEGDVDVPEALVVAKEKKAAIEEIDLAGQPEITQKTLNVLVKAGLVTTEEAEALGWTPPTLNP